LQRSAFEEQAAAEDLTVFGEQQDVELPMEGKQPAAVFDAEGEKLAAESAADG
jgi:hypothetical protein